MIDISWWFFILKTRNKFPINSSIYPISNFNRPKWFVFCLWMNSFFFFGLQSVVSGLFNVVRFEWMFIIIIILITTFIQASQAKSTKKTTTIYVRFLSAYILPHTPMIKIIDNSSLTTRWEKKTKKRKRKTKLVSRFIAQIFHFFFFRTKVLNHSFVQFVDLILGAKPTILNNIFM